MSVPAKPKERRQVSKQHQLMNPGNYCTVLNWGSAPALQLQKYEKVRITNQAEYQTISRLAGHCTTQSHCHPQQVKKVKHSKPVVSSGEDSHTNVS
jgi:hypothetical protein